ncbi:hypothetical protein BO94DRAFT_572100 [Aspergillus sclerotioniger CBS 115572]|uniref:RanBD1 domain-containing protein n=1 Tax=Aspergillus sclerotioniger CBS 115572 TaxID=1450535 RepID=A0A317X891_9EURO|nr:hypothetical protein BO94DRAFT_572100 [Aspergillus sclerotioniger CBS 115572]PWY94495.1 hypothetical protein BO94DRAFT_572100 [Aspergillus sclerotioniger CBS 115572]
MSSTPDDKPQRATAAQMANRKIRDVRKRRPNSAAPSAPTPSFGGGPFNSIDPNTVSSTPANSQPPSNGFTFGQNQSFPGANLAPAQSNQNGGTPFAFGSGGGSSSSSFNFSSSFGGTSSTSNPFASMNTTSSDQSKPASFSGFQGSLFNVPPGGSQSPAQQPLPSGSMFGTPSQQSASTGGLFGSNPTSGPSASSGTATSTTGSIFGQNNAAPSTPSTNVFGQSSVKKPSPFGQSTAFGSDSMQTSPDAKGGASQSKPSIFDNAPAPPPSFGGATSFSSTGGTSLFGAPASSAAETPSKPVFDFKATTPSSSLFGGAPTQATSIATPSASTPAPTAASTAAPASSSMFGAASPAKPSTPFQNPFQSSNLFQSASSTAQKPAEEKKEEVKPAESQPKPPFQFTSSSATGPSLFSKSEATASAAPAAPAAPSTGLFQTSSTKNLFEPKPAATAAPEQPKAAGNPFGGLFAKPATPSKPAVEQQPLPSSSTPFQGLFSKPSTPNDAAKTSEPEKQATPGQLSFTPSSNGFSQTSNLFAPKPSASPAPAAEVKAPAPLTSAASVESPFKVNGTKSTPPAPTNGIAAPSSFGQLQTPKLSDKGDKKITGDAEMLYRMRVLNECFKREMAKMDPSTQNFDAAVQFYMRVRATLGASVGSKRKASGDDVGELPTKVQSFGTPFGHAAAPKESSTTPAVTAPSSTPFKAFGTSQAASTSGKRKSIDDGDDSSPAKRVNGDSTTASIFAQSFSKSKTESDQSVDSEPSSARPSTPESTKPALFSTTPSTAPAKPLFSFPGSGKKDTPSAPLFSSMSSASLTSAAPAGDAPKNPFVLKPTGNEGNSASSASGLPKFSSTGGTDFFAQFRAQSAKDAEKEKEKRKAEDYDSEEEDEAEWERRDAEEQRLKQSSFESQTQKRAIFVPGKGFVFGDESSDSSDKKPEEASAATPSADTSVFAKQNNTSMKSSNIFGHLSATPSEADDNDNDADDTEEASTPGDESDDATESSPAKTSTADAKADAAESSAKELESGGRSLFDRVQYDEEGKPKRQGEEEQKGSMSTLFGSSKFSSSFNTPTSLNPASSSDSNQAASKPATTSIFGAANTSSSIFGTPLSSSGNNTPSLFSTGPGITNSAADKTWKPNSPIKFATDPASASTSKPDSGSATPAPEAPKPFSNLFGAPPSLTKSSTSKSTQPSLGFSFGAPNQSAPSLLAPSILNSATPSRSSTPGGASDTGAEESGDGEAAESLPQVDLARGGAGEENEDLVTESRARAMKHTTAGGWESQGVGFLRVLKDRTTSRGRILVRADPSGNVILNARLMNEIRYTVAKNSVQFMVPQVEGPPQLWALRVKTNADAERLCAAMEETKN